MDRETAQSYAERLSKSGVPTTAATMRETGPLSHVWGVRTAARTADRVYAHYDAMPPQWRHVLETACINCGTTQSTSPMFNTATGEHDMWCAPCFHGDGQAAAA